jgi:hypothetical protein
MSFISENRKPTKKERQRYVVQKIRMLIGQPDDNSSTSRSEEKAQLTPPGFADPYATSFFDRSRW